jgi:ABC-type uncharacterized transport system ATPase subunit
MVLLNRVTAVPEATVMLATHTNRMATLCTKIAVIPKKEGSDTLDPFPCMVFDKA